MLDIQIIPRKNDTVEIGGFDVPKCYISDAIREIYDDPFYVPDICTECNCRVYSRNSFNEGFCDRLNKEDCFEPWDITSCLYRHDLMEDDRVLNMALEMYLDDIIDLTDEGDDE